MRITLKIFDRDEEFDSRVLDEGVIRLGRSDFSDIVLPNDSISRTHLEVKVTDQSVYVTNMSTTGKVRVNGRFVETAELNDGDEVNVGPYRIVCVFGDVAAPDLGAQNEVPPVEEMPPSEENNPNEPNNVENQVPISEPKDDLEIVGPGGDPIQMQPSSASAPYNMEMRVEGTAALQRAETVVENKPVVAKLVFTEGPRIGQELFLETYEVSFGRSKRADIFLDDQKLSRIHAKITRVGMGYRLIDLNSRNGTYVNGVRVLEHPLTSFDTIEIGHSKIKFLIHDLMSGEAAKGPMALDNLQSSNAVDGTKSLQLVPTPPEMGMNQFPQTPVPPPLGPQTMSSKGLPFRLGKRRSLAMILLAVLLLFGVGYLLLPEKKTDTVPVATQNAAPSAPGETRVLSPVLSKEYLELTPEMQKTVEGYYTTALRAADRDMWEEAVLNLKKIHEVLPSYKQSKELLEQYTRKLKEKQIRDAEEKAKKDDKQEIALLIQEGTEYLRDGEFDRAADSFNAAINLEPNNQTAIKGLKASGLRIRSIEQLPPDRDPEEDKKKQVKELFDKAVSAFASKSYETAIDAAEEIRKIELRGDTSYLNSAKQIIDKSKMLQKEEFEPFLVRAKENFQEGDYNASRDLCEEMLKKDPAYGEAKECVLKAKKQLNRLAKEAYTHGYVLESLNRIEEAKQYWTRARNYVRPGDEYYDKVLKKLEQYQ